LEKIDSLFEAVVTEQDIIGFIFWIESGVDEAFRLIMIEENLAFDGVGYFHRLAKTQGIEVEKVEGSVTLKKEGLVFCAIIKIEGLQVFFEFIQRLLFKDESLPGIQFSPVKTGCLTLCHQEKKGGF